MREATQQIKMDRQNLKRLVFTTNYQGPGAESINGIPVIVTDHQFYTNEEVVVFVPAVNNKAGNPGKFITPTEVFLSTHSFNEPMTRHLWEQCDLEQENLNKIKKVFGTPDLSDAFVAEIKEQENMEFMPRAQG